MFSIIKNTFQRAKLPTARSLYPHPPPTSYRLGTVARREAILVLPRAAQGGSAGSVCPQVYDGQQHSSLPPRSNTPIGRHPTHTCPLIGSPPPPQEIVWKL